MRPGGCTGEGNYLARGAKKAASRRVFSLRHQIHSHHSLSGRAHSAIAQLEKWSGKRLERRERAGNQRLLLSRISFCIARGGATELIYARRENFLHLCTHGLSVCRLEVCCQGVTLCRRLLAWLRCSFVCLTYIYGTRNAIMALFARTRSPAERKSRCHSSACV